MPGTPGSARRPARSNRACRLCRARKIKCDGLRPTCGICRSQDSVCTYEHDRRQTSRVSQATIQHLTARLAAVDDTVQQLQRNLQQGQVAQALTPVDTSTTFLGSFEDINHHDATQTMDLEPSTAMHVGTDTNHNLTESFPRPRSEQLDGSGNNRDLHETSPVEIHIVVQNEGRISVYGPSSTFHVPNSHAPNHQSLSTPGGSNPSRPRGRSPFMEDEQSTEESRCRLFANSALQLQKEWTYMTERRFDLDGLDFDTAWHLLQLHWNHHHLSYLLTYRPAIIHSLATGGPYVNKLLLNSIYFSSALNSDRKDLYDDPSDRQSLGRRFFSRIQQLVLPDLESSSIPSAVALIVIGSSLVSNGRQTAGWFYSGLGYRMMIDLGLHVNAHKLRISDPDPSQPQIRFTDLDLELQRRVYWGAYINDKFQSLYFGRPPALTAVGIEPSRTCLDSFEELELWSPYIDVKTNSIPMTYVPQPAYTLSTFHSFIQLAEIMCDVIDRLYSPKVQFVSKCTVLGDAQGLLKKLDRWSENLPRHLRCDPQEGAVPPAHRFNPPMTFHMLHILLHRPFLPEGHLRHLADQQEDVRRDICISSAFKIYELAKAYREAFTLRRAPYMFSYALFSAASIIPFKSSSRSEPVDLSQQHIVGFFWTALKELQNGANFGLRRPIMIIRSLIERAGLDLNAIVGQAASGQETTNEGQQHARSLRLMPQGTTPDTSRQVASNDLDQNLPFLDDSGFETLCRDLLSGNMDGLNSPVNIDLDDDSLLYGLFRQT